MDKNNTVVGLQEVIEPLMDPLLKFSWYPASMGHSYLQLHLHEIIYSLIFYVILYQFVSPQVNKKIFGKSYKKAPTATKIDFDVHLVSTVQAIISISGCIPVLFLPTNSFNIANYYHPFCSLLAAISVGYFLWDLYICLRWYRIYGAQFLIHAGMALYCTMLPLLLGVCQIWVPKFLVYELSTPFVNINWYCKQLSLQGVQVPAFLNLLNGLILIVVFFLVRICWGNVALTLYLAECFHFVESFSVSGLLLVGGLVMCNVVLNALNVFWFNKMIRLAFKLARGTAEAKKRD